MAFGVERVLGCVQQRYVLSMMLLLAVINIFAMRVCLSMAIVEMVSRDPKRTTSSSEAAELCPQDEAAGGNTTITTFREEQGQGKRFDWSSGMEGQVLSSFYYGYIVAHIPGGLLADKFGGKHTLGLGVLCTAVSTILCAPCAYLGPGALIGLRVATGLGEGVTFPAVNVLLAHWVPLKERSRLGTLVFSGVQLGTMFGTAFSGLLLHNFHWSSVFYFFGGMGVLWYVFWMLLCHSTPGDHPYVSAAERRLLAESIAPTGLGSQGVTRTPWRGILTSVPVWGLALAQVGHDWGLFTIATDLPKYMKSVLHFSITANGVYSALPYFVMWITALACGAIADWLVSRDKLSILGVRKLFTSLASVVPAVGIIAASYAGCDRTLVVLLFTVGMGGMGAFYPGMRVNALDLSRRHAGTVMALVNGLGAVSGAVSPALIGYLTPNDTLAEWRLIFWITFGVLLASNVVYVLTAQASIQPFDKDPEIQQVEAAAGGSNNIAPRPRT